MKTIIEIKHDRINDNLDFVSKTYKDKFFFVLKNNAYNTGLITTFKECLKKNYTSFAVCTLDEALTIKALKKDIEVFIMNPLNKGEILIASYNDFIIGLPNYDWYLENYDQLQDVTMHIKVNVGMNRFGINDIDLINKLINENKNIKGIYTHFSHADTRNTTLHNEQVERFIDIYNQITNKAQLEIIHSENSATLVLQDPRLSFCNYARFGVLGYGMAPIDIIKELKPIVFVSSYIILINKVKKGEYIGYGADVQLKKDTIIAVCPIGYGNGLSQTRKIIPVIINDKKYRILAISLSHTLLEIDDNVSLNDEVEFYGDKVILEEQFLIDDIATTVHLSALHTNLK